MDAELLKLLLQDGPTGLGVILLAAAIILRLRDKPEAKAEPEAQWVRQVTTDLARVGDDLAHVRDLVMEYHREETNRLEDLHRKVIELRFRPPAA